MILKHTKSLILARLLSYIKGLWCSCTNENISVLQKVAIRTLNSSAQYRRNKVDKSFSVSNYKYGWTPIFPVAPD